MLGVAGCALPDYHLPHGFSSTYYRHLQQGQPTIVSPPSPWQSSTTNGATLPRVNQPLDVIPPAPPAAP